MTSIKYIKSILRLVVALALLFSSNFIQSQVDMTKVENNLTGNIYTDFEAMQDKSRIDIALSSSLKLIVQPYYGYLKNGDSGREITLVFNEKGKSGKLKIELESLGQRESFTLILSKDILEYKFLLPAGIGVTTDDKVEITISGSGLNISKTITIPKKRQWTVYLYPHSHVDIGYTNTQKNAEIIHARNLVNGIKLATNTVNYPDGARYLWNPEVLWPFERYLGNATPEEKRAIIDGVRKGYLRLDAGYANIMTSAASDEQLIEFFRYKTLYEKLTDKPIETLVQVDVPGMSWGMVPVAAKKGIKYVLSLNNGSDRVGHSTEQSFKPFWWADESGKNKVLFYQAGSYNPGALIKGYLFWPSMAGQTDPAKLLQIVKTENPRENFIDGYINKILPELEGSDYYPYDIFAMSWAMADNTPIDADLPEAVKSWNAEYAYPKLIIAGATDFMHAFDEKYGDGLPILKGDFTEYWTDGLGTAAKYSGMNRNTMERLVQAETLWTMLQPGKPAPSETFNEAWRNVILGTEHTWAYMAPDQQPLSDEILQVKLDHFETAEKLSHELLSKAMDPVQKTEGSTFGIFNTLSWNRSGVVKINRGQAKDYNSVFDNEGNRISSQILSNGDMLFLANNVPAFGSKKYKLSHKKDRANVNIAKENVLDNGIVRVSIDTITGDIGSIIRGGKEFVKLKGKSKVNTYKYLHGDDSPDKATSTTSVKYRIMENGPLLARIVIEAEAEGCNNLLREITLYKDQAYIEIKNTVDKIAITDKEGVHFGFAFDIENPKMVSDIPWGIMEIEKDQILGANKNWITTQRWVDISNDKSGVAWSSLDAPMFEVNDITANILGSASDSNQWISHLKPNGTIYSWALNNHWHTNFQLSQGGRIVFRYAILPYNTKGDLASSNRFGLEQFRPLVISAVKDDFNPQQVLGIDGNPSVTVSVFKPSKDGKSALLRIRSISKQDEMVKLNWYKNKPSFVNVYDISDNTIKEKIDDSLMIPAMDFVTLNVVW